MSHREIEKIQKQKVREQCVKHQKVLNQEVKTSKVEELSATSASVSGNLSAGSLSADSAHVGELGATNINSQTINSQTINSQTITVDQLIVNGGLFDSCQFPTPVSGPTTITESGRYIICKSFEGKVTIQGRNISLDLNNLNITNSNDCALYIVNSDQVTVFSGSLASSSQEAVCVENSSDVQLTSINVSNIETPSAVGVGRVGKGNLTKAALMITPYGAIKATNSNGLTLDRWNVKDVAGFAGIFDAVSNATWKNSQIRRIRGFSEANLVSVSNSQNFQYTKMAMDDVQDVISESIPEKSAVRFQNVLDSAIDRSTFGTIQTASVNTGTELKNSKFSVVNFNGGASLGFTNSKINGNIMDGFGWLNMEFNGFNVKNVRDLISKGNQLNDNVGRPNAQGENAEINAVKVEDSQYTDFFSNKVNTTSLAEGGVGRHEISAFNFVGGREHTFDSNEGLSGGTVGWTGTGIVKTIGTKFNGLFGNAFVKNSNFSSNGDENTTESSGLESVTEDPVANIRVENVTSNDIKSQLLSFGAWITPNRSTVRGLISNGGFAGTFATAQKRKSNLSKPLPPRLVVPNYKEVKARSVSDINVERKAKLAAYNVNNVAPQAVACYFSGTSTREQFGASATGCEFYGIRRITPSAKKPILASKDIIADPKRFRTSLMENVAGTNYGLVGGRLLLPSLNPFTTNRLEIANNIAGDNIFNFSLNEVAGGFVNNNKSAGGDIGYDLNAGKNITVDQNSAVENVVGHLATTCSARFTNNLIQQGTVGILDGSDKPNALTGNQSSQNETAFTITNGVAPVINYNPNDGKLTSVTGEPTLTAQANVAVNEPC